MHLLFKYFSITFLFLQDLLFGSVFSATHFEALDTEVFEECLLELKIPELLRLQRSLARIPDVSAPSDIIATDSGAENMKKCKVEEEQCLAPEAMALVAENRGYAQQSYADHHQPWQMEEKPSKLQTLFQISVTALAFLSFGGYLLCLIVQAIKSKGTTYFHPVATAATTNNNAGIKRIKIYRRSRRSFKNKSVLWTAPNIDSNTHKYYGYLIHMLDPRNNV